MKAKLICYSLGKINHAERSLFKREFIGYEDKSNHGKYKYERKGLLNTIPCLKPIRSVIIVKNKDFRSVEKILDKFKAKFFVFDVLVPKF